MSVLRFVIGQQAIGVQLCGPRGFSELLQDVKLVIGNRLFCEIQSLCDIPIGPAQHKDQFNALQSFPCTGLFEFGNQGPQDGFDELGFRAGPFTAAEHAGGTATGSGELARG
ncbi:MAG: hypothetical protein RL215_3360, partial [Planctomycetota bacterium]